MENVVVIYNRGGWPEQVYSFIGEHAEVKAKAEAAFAEVFNNYIGDGPAMLAKALRDGYYCVDSPGTESESLHIILM